jgi:WD40 repeat protein
VPQALLKFLRIEHRIGKIDQERNGNDPGEEQFKIHKVNSHVTLWLKQVFIMLENGSKKHQNSRYSSKIRGITGREKPVVKLKFGMIWVFILLVLAACGTDSPTPTARPPRTIGPLPTLNPVPWHSAHTALTVDNANQIQQIGTLSGATGTINRFNFSHSGKLLVGVGGDQTLHVWNLTNGSEAFAPQSKTAFAYFTPDDSMLVTVTSNATLKFIAATDGKSIQETPVNPDGVSAAALSPDGTTLVTGGTAGSLLIWSLPIRVVTRSIPGVPPNAPIDGLAFAPDGKTIATLSKGDSVIRIWRVDNGELLKSLSGFKTSPLRLVFSANHLVIGTVSQVYICDVQTFNILIGVETEGLAVERGLAISPDEHLVAVASNTDKVYVWSMTDGAPQATLPGHTGGVSDTVFSPNGQFIVTLMPGTGQGVFLWNTSSLHPDVDKYVRATIGQGANGFFRAVWSPDGSTLFLGDISGGVMVWGIPAP